MERISTANHSNPYPRPIVKEDSTNSATTKRAVASSQCSRRTKLAIPLRLRRFRHPIDQGIKPLRNWWAGKSRRTRRVLGGTVAVLLASFAFILFSVMSSRAATAVLVPDTDITTGWPITSGTNDASCSGGTYCDFVDEGTVADSGDYIGTGIDGSGGEVLEFGIESTTGVNTVTEVVVYFYGQSATNANGSTLDNVSINLRVDGTLQTATTVTPAYNNWAWHSATFTGSWTQAQLDGMQVELTRNQLGSGSPNGMDDDIQIAAVYVEITFTQNISLEQAAFRFYEHNEDGDNTFASSLGGTDYGYAAVATADGGYAAAGHSSVSDAGSGDIVLAKYNKAGKVQWMQMVGGTAADRSYELVQTSDHGFVVAGYTESYGAGGQDFILVKYSAGGTYEWTRTIGGSGNDVVEGLLAIDDGGFIVAGPFAVPSGFSTNNDAAIIRYDINGNVTWAKSLGGSSTDRFDDVALTQDGGYLVTGRTNSYGAGDYDVWIAKYSMNGTLEWTRVMGGTGVDRGYGIRQTSDGGFIVTGDTTSYGSGLTDVFLAKYDNTASLEWMRVVGGAGDDGANGLALGDNGEYRIVGQTTSYGNGETDVLFLQFSTSGTLDFMRTLGGATTDRGDSIETTSDDGSFIVGRTASFTPAAGHDLLVAKFDSSGMITECAPTTCLSHSPTVSTVTPTTSTPSPTDSTQSPSVSSPSPVLATPSLSTQVIAALFGPSVGTPLATTNTPVTVPAVDTPFRLRLGLGITGSDLLSGSFKLQFAPQDADNVCDNDEPGYADITSSSSLRYYASVTGSDQADYVLSASDPVRSGITAVRQTYEENNPYSVTNPIAANEDGLWDFALTFDPAATPGSYCIRTLKDDGTQLNTYSTMPEITVPPPMHTQAGYRWFEHANTGTSGAEVGSPLATRNSAANALAEGVPMRLRGLVGIDNAELASGQAYKLQYAAKGSVCDNTLTYSDVSPTIGEIRFYDEIAYEDGISVVVNANDPTDGSRTILTQRYVETSTFTSSSIIRAGEDGMWDFSLVRASGANGSYCFRMVKSDGALLDTYSYYPELVVAASNTPPAAPSLSTVASGSTGASTTPLLSLRSSDADGDYLRYKIDVCGTSDCSVIVRTIDQTALQDGWSGQDQQTETAYTGSSTLSASKLATHTYQKPLLSLSTTYWWRAYAIDPGGSNTWSASSEIHNFTTLSGNAVAPGSSINGGIQIKGGTRIRS